MVSNGTGLMFVKIRRLVQKQEGGGGGHTNIRTRAHAQTETHTAWRSSKCTFFVKGEK
jgi:hypothetical protein